MAIERFECPNCKAGMEFNPVTGDMKCAYCGTRIAVEVDPTSNIHENPLSD